MVGCQGSALPVLTFPKAQRQLLHPQLWLLCAFHSARGQEMSHRLPKPSHSPCKKINYWNSIMFTNTDCLPPRRVLLMEANTYPETTDLKRKTSCVQILIKERSLPK